MTERNTPPETNMDELTIALARLAEHGVPVDIQELLIHGNVSLGVPPGALAAALSAAPSPSLHVLPSKDDLRRALETIERANGADLDEWTKGELPSDVTSEALAAIRSMDELCEDEGCDHYGSPHICRSVRGSEE